MDRLTHAAVACGLVGLLGGCAVGDWVGVSVGDDGGCAWQADGRVDCWVDHKSDGAPTRAALDPPAGLRVRSVAVGGGSSACAITTEGTLSCWTGEGGNGPETVDAPAGEFLEVAMDPQASLVLGISADGYAGPWEFGVPDEWDAGKVGTGYATSITGGILHPPPMWLDRGGRIEWWDSIRDREEGYRDAHGQNIADRLVDWPLVQLAASYEEVCALCTDGVLECVRGLWQFPDGHYHADGKYKAVDLGDDYNCGVRDDDEVHCWGPNLNDLPPDPLPGVKFSTLSVGVRGGCGVTTGGAIRCWTRDGPPANFGPEE